MSGTVVGGKAAAQTNKQKYGQDFYKNIGAKGGSVNGVAKGFAADRERARRAGAKGGSISKRNRTIYEEPKHQGIIDKVKEVFHHG